MAGGRARMPQPGGPAFGVGPTLWTRPSVLDWSMRTRFLLQPRFDSVQHRGLPQGPVVGRRKHQDGLLPDFFAVAGGAAWGVQLASTFPPIRARSDYAPTRDEPQPDQPLAAGRTEQVELPSLNLLLDLVQSERDKQRAHFDSLGGKAGIILGFTGLIITLAPNCRSGMSSFWCSPHLQLQVLPWRPSFRGSIQSLRWGRCASTSPPRRAMRN